MSFVAVSMTAQSQIARSIGHPTKAIVSTMPAKVRISPTQNFPASNLYVYSQVQNAKTTASSTAAVFDFDVLVFDPRCRSGDEEPDPSGCSPDVDIAFPSPSGRLRTAHLSIMNLSESGTAGSNAPICPLGPPTWACPRSASGPQRSLRHPLGGCPGPRSRKERRHSEIPALSDAPIIGDPPWPRSHPGRKFVSRDSGMA